MVQKSSFRGVHSGNTLRATDSRYRHRYYSQSCIVSRVHSNLLRSLRSADERKDPEAIGKPQNVSVDVALSLNKQERWLLPFNLKQQIAASSMIHGLGSGLTVSMLERHKLRRRANCVSFRSNSGTITNIQPRKGHYFSFDFPLSEGKSRRELRREKRAERLQVQSVHLSKDQRKGKIVEVYPPSENEGHLDDLAETEVRYEIYYPCPSTCSIAHNPKYIKLNMTGDHPEHGVPTKQHRRKQRMGIMLQDMVDDFDCNANDLYTDNSTDQLEDDNDDLSSYSGSTNQKTEDRSTEYLITSLIDKAEQLQKNYLNSSVSSPKHKRYHIKKESEHSKDSKAHIIYIPSPEIQEKPKSDPAVKSTPPLTSSTRIVLANDEVSTSSLRDTFGQNYLEAECNPRKFVIDVTDSVKDVMKKKEITTCRTSNNEDVALSFLIFICDGFFDDGLEIYKIFLNTNLQENILAVQFDADELIFQGTMLSVVSKTMDFVDNLLEKKQALGQERDQPSIIKNLPNMRCITEHLGISDSYMPSIQQKFCETTQLQVVELSSPMSLAQILAEESQFCDICYDDVSPLILDGAPATTLTKCGHRVCNCCWFKHIQSQLSEGSVRILCPGYDCKEEPNLGVLLSLIHLDAIIKLHRQIEEVRISVSKTEKWCPNEKCGRILRLHLESEGLTVHKEELSQLQHDVLCECGAQVCFQCLGPAHWPSLCAQAQAYRTELENNSILTLPVEETHDDYLTELEAHKKLQQETGAKGTILVEEGKHCPKCKIFIKKRGDNPSIFCCCGHTFCWGCGKEGLGHHDRIDCVDKKTEKKMTTVIIHHPSNVKQSHVSLQEKSVNRRQRLSMTERALEQRYQRLSNKTKKGILHAINALAKSVATACNRNPEIERQVLQKCTQHISNTNLPCPSSAPVETSIMKLVTSFLKNAFYRKQEVLEIAEYTLLLLKDVPDCVLKHRALRIAEDLNAFSTFTQSIIESWSEKAPGTCHQEAVEAIIRLSEIQQWIHSTLQIHITTICKIRTTMMTV